MPRAAVNGIEIEYEEIGPSGGPLLLLITGLGGQLTSWDDDFCHRLAGEGFRVVRFDNRDSGLSTHLEHLGVPDVLGAITGEVAAGYSLEDMADDAAGLLDHLGAGAAHVVGLSLGGMLAQLLAIRRPDLVLTLTSIMSDAGGPDRLPPEPALISVLLTPASEEPGGRIAQAVALRRALAGPASGFDEATARHRAELQQRRAYSPASTMRQAMAVLAAPDRAPELARLSVPALLIHGEADPLIPIANGRRLAAAMPHARFIALEGVGHDIPAEAAETIVAALLELAAARR